MPRALQPWHGDSAAQTLPASGPAPNGVSLPEEIIAKQARTIGVTASDKVEAWTAIQQARSGFSKDHYLLAAALLERVRAAVGLN